MQKLGECYFRVEKFFLNLPGKFNTTSFEHYVMTTDTENVGLPTRLIIASDGSKLNKEIYFRFPTMLTMYKMD